MSNRELFELLASRMNEVLAGTGLEGIVEPMSVYGFHDLISKELPAIERDPLIQEVYAVLYKKYQKDNARIDKMLAIMMAAPIPLAIPLALSLPEGSLKTAVLSATGITAALISTVIYSGSRKQKK